MDHVVTCVHDSGNHRTTPTYDEKEQTKNFVWPPIDLPKHGRMYQNSTGTVLWHSCC